MDTQQVATSELVAQKPKGPRTYRSQERNALKRVRDADGKMSPNERIAWPGYPSVKWGKPRVRNHGGTLRHELRRLVLARDPKISYDDLGRYSTASLIAALQETE